MNYTFKRDEFILVEVVEYVSIVYADNSIVY